MIVFADLNASLHSKIKARGITPCAFGLPMPRALALIAVCRAVMLA